jgi:hypothetical protein
MNIVALVTFVLGMVVGAVLLRAYEYWAGQPKSAKEWAIKMMIEAAALTAEKMFLGQGRGEEKLNFVLNWVRDEAAKEGLNFDVDAVTKWVTEFVDEMNKTNWGQDVER